MPTVLTHPAVPLAMSLALGRKVCPAPLIVAGVIAAILPDLDIVTFYLGLPLSHEFGHRGFSHSISFAALAALFGAYFLKNYKIPWQHAFCFLFLSIFSHGLLDAFTNGGHGIAFFWPFSTTRYFAPYRIIEIAPIHFERIFSSRVAVVLLSEIVWVWSTLLFIAMISFSVRKLIYRIPLIQAKKVAPIPVKIDFSPSESYVIRNSLRDEG